MHRDNTAHERVTGGLVKGETELTNQDASWSEKADNVQIFSASAWLSYQHLHQKTKGEKLQV